MEIKNWQLAAIIAGTFAAVILIDILMQYQSNEDFRAKFPGLPTAMFAKTRAVEMVAQEMAPMPHPVEPTFADDDNPSEDS